MNRFKPGDRVICHTPKSLGMFALNKDTIYTIKEVIGYRVILNDKTLKYMSNRFQLVPDLTEEQIVKEYCIDQPTI